MPDFSLHWIMFHLKRGLKPKHFQTFMRKVPVLNLDRRPSVLTEGIRDVSRYPCAKVWKTPVIQATSSTFHIHSNALLTTIIRSRQILFRETDVVHRITFSFSYFFLLVVLFTQFIVGKMKKSRVV